MILTLDGIGEGISCGIWRGKTNGDIELLQTFDGNGSLGWFYSNVTEALGWWHGDGEGKTMGLAPYGNESALKTELEKYCPQYKDGLLVKPHEFGGFSTLNEGGASQFHFKDATSIKALLKSFSSEDIAASAQKILEKQVQNNRSSAGLLCRRNISKC